VDSAYATGQPGISASAFGGVTLHILTFTGGTLGGGTGDTTPPILSNGQPSGALAAGTSQATLSVTTSENATCRYATTPGVAFASMPNIFTTTGATTHSSALGGLTNGTAYSYYVKCQDTAGNADTTDYTIAFSVAAGDTTPPILSNGQPSGALAAGTTQATLSVTTSENATCRYATTPGVAFASMPDIFTTTGATTHSSALGGLTNGTAYNYYVKCQDTAGNADTTDYTIAFSVATASGGGGSGSTVSSSFTGVEDPLSEGGMWDTPGAWSRLKKDGGAYSTDTFSAARLATPVVGPDEFSEITYDQDPGASAWIAVMTRVQGKANGSGYLAMAYDGAVRFYRVDDNGSLSFTQLGFQSEPVAVAPRDLRLESQGSTHKVYLNGALAITYVDSTYATGQPGISASAFGGVTLHILTFTGGTLSSN